MQSSLPSLSPLPYNRGLASLRTFQRNRCSVVEHQYSHAPLQWLGPVDPSVPRPLMYLRNPNGGLLGGDHHHIELNLGEDTHLEIRSQSATRLHPGKSSQVVQMTLAAHSSLIWIPHPLIPGRDADFQQRIQIALHPNARLAYADIWAGGRLAMGEAWAFHSINNELSVHHPKEWMNPENTAQNSLPSLPREGGIRTLSPSVFEALEGRSTHFMSSPFSADEGHLLVLERSRLIAADGWVSTPASLAPYTCWGSLYLMGDWPDPEWLNSDTQWQLNSPSGRILRQVGHQAMAIWDSFARIAQAGCYKL